MTDPQLTRRSLLAGLAGAGAGVVTGAPAVLAATRVARRQTTALGAAAPAHFAQSVGDVGAGVQLVRAPARFDLAGVAWSAPRDARIWLALPGSAGWALASGAGHGPDGVDDGRAGAVGGEPGAAAGALPCAGDPIWTGPANAVLLRAAAPVRDVVVHFVDVSTRAPARPAGVAAADLPLAQPVLDAGPGQPPIIARQAWAQGRAPAPVGGSAYGVVKLAFVHHTENLNGYSSADVPGMLLAIWAFHRFVRGWRDIGYNFVIDRFGRAFEARGGGIDEPVLGAQAGGYNGSSSGVAMLGDFSGQHPSAAAHRALADLLAWKLSLHGAPALGHVDVQVSAEGAVFSRFPAGSLVRLQRVAGHRDADATLCPGDALYGELPALRRRVNVLAGRPLRATLTAQSTQITAPGPIVFAGELAYLDGTPLPGATLALQSRHLPGFAATPRETTLTQLTSDAGGRFGGSLAAGYNASLRVLFAGSAGVPASVSDPLDVSVAPALTLSAAAQAVAVGTPVTVSGTITPPRAARVTVDVSQQRSDGSQRRVAALHSQVSAGSFSVTVTLQAPGDYLCLARTPADDRNAAGASPPLALVAGSAPSPSPTAPAPTAGAPAAGA